jgi:uncharacterized membrane protein
MILAQIPGWTDRLTQVISEDIGRIAWNICLALIPLALSFFLFYQPKTKWFCWSIYVTLGFSFIIGIKKYDNGNILEALKRMAISLWGVRAIFLAIAVGLIIILMIMDMRSRSHQTNNRSIFWWIGLLLFIVFLPNAPYILTDIIHFYDAVRNLHSVWAITLVIVPIYTIFIGFGWFAYVFSLINVGRYLEKQHLDRYIKLTEISLHIMCAIGIYIGRFLRFNSWDAIAEPIQFISVLPGELIGKFPIVVISLTCLIITVFYTIWKYIINKSLTFYHR